MPVIDVHELSKVYRIPEKEAGVKGAIKGLFRPRHRSLTAVDGISFGVEPGEVVGYIGVNGAGKSTTIKLLTGILLPSAGQVRVLGRDPHVQRVANARQIGVVFGQRTQLWWDLALIESLNTIARIYEVEPARYKQLLAQFTETLELGELLHTPIRNMSLGQKMRAELAAALIHEPPVVYLDEPTIGLDLIVKERIREFIKQQNQARGTTIVLTTHDLGDIEELCRRVIIIDKGRLIYDGPIQTIKERFGKYRTITFETCQPPGALNLPPGVEVYTNGHAAGERAREERAGEAGESEARVGEERAGEASESEARAGEERAGEASESEARAGEERAGEASESEARAGEERAAEERKLVLRFDRTRASASQVAAAIMEQIEVVDFSLSEPGLASIVRQIYNGALQEEPV